MRRTSFLLALTAAIVSASMAASRPPRGLKAECRRVDQVYPLLMLVVMAEGPMNCSATDDGSEFVDCDSDETAAEKAAHAKRLEIRKYQEAAYRKASDACIAWRADMRSGPLGETAAAAIAEARRADRGVLTSPAS